ncbi:helix-turn-helix domain-containing protein [Paenibacillus polymyxa]|uniref:helix-turn-helix domain-containing protein n=1 Tax=Paenibacillus polymyxa TaxID=1406 RepID=UPI003D2BA6AB
MMTTVEYKSKEEYPSVLDAKHIQAILGIGERQTYELLNSDQFHTVRVGRMIKVSKEVFLRWLEG